MVGQRLGRWRGEAGHREGGAVARLGLSRRAAAAARSSLRPWPRRDCLDAGNDRRSGLLSPRTLRSGQHPRGPRPCGPVGLPSLTPALPRPFLSPSRFPLSPRQSSLLAVPPCPEPGCPVTDPGAAFREPAPSAPFPSGRTCGEGELVSEGSLRATPHNPAKKVLDLFF